MKTNRRALYVLLALAIVASIVLLALAPHHLLQAQPLIAPDKLTYLFDSLLTGGPGFVSPLGVARDAQGRIYVAESNGGVIQVFDDTNKYVTGFGDDIPLEFPYGVALDDNGNIYVSDYSLEKIFKFDSAFQLVTSWGGHGTANGKLFKPAGIAVHGQRLYVVEVGNNRVQVFDLNGIFKKKFGAVGSGDGQFYGAYGIAVDNAGNVYVADTGNNRLQKFNKKFKWVATWGSLGTGNGAFNYPRLMAFDSIGRLFVADEKNNRVQILDKNGIFLGKFGKKGTGNGQFKGPVGVAVDPSGNIVHVSDRMNARVERWYKQGFTPQPLPDLVVQSVSLIMEGRKPSGCVPQLGNLLMQVTVKNVGTADASAFDVSMNGTAQAVSNGLAAAATVDLFFSNFAPNGQNTAIADSTNAVVESNEANNEYNYVSITATPPLTCTLTVIPSRTPTKTLTPTATFTRTRTRTFTPTSSNTPTNTRTFTPTNTPTITPTPTFVMFGDGSDGALNYTTYGIIINSFSAINSTTSAGSTTIPVSSITGFSANHEIMIHQSQGTDVGTYEFATIASVGIGTLTLTKPIVNTYTIDSTSHAHIVSVPHYTDVTIPSDVALATLGWNGSSGGIIVFRSNGTTTINGTVGLSGGGYSLGGKGRQGASSPIVKQTGEGTLGYSTTTDTGGCSNGTTSSYGSGGGFGADCEHQSGGGGGHQATGGRGQSVYNGNISTIGGEGGISSGSDDLSVMTFGGQGGGGSSSYSGIAGNGGAGGGILVIIAKSIVINGGVVDNGANGQNGNQNGGWAQAGGGGAGGSILIRAETANLGSNLVTAVGGSGGVGVSDVTAKPYGGDGSAGRIRVEYCSSGIGATNPPASVQIITCY